MLVFVGNPWTSMVFQKNANHGGLIIEQWACEEIGKTDLPNWLGNLMENMLPYQLIYDDVLQYVDKK